MASLPSLPTGTAWFWSPRWLDVFTRVRIRRRESFDSSATPRIGTNRQGPKILAAVDLKRLRSRLSAMIEKARAEDPRELRWRIAELEKAGRPPTTIERVEVPVLHEDQVKKLEELVVTLRAVAEDVSLALTKASGQKRGQEQRANAPLSAPTRVPSPRPPSRAKASGQIPARDDLLLKAGERRMLETLLRRYPTKLTRAQLGTLAGFTPSGGTFGTYFGTLKRHGLIRATGNGDIEITPAGLAYLGSEVTNTPQTTEEVLAMWQRALKKGEWRMLEALVEVHPKSLKRDELGEQTGYTASGGTFGTYLGTLRRNGLIDVSGEQVRASDTLF
jgi:hypothetical protein